VKYRNTVQRIKKTKCGDTNLQRKRENTAKTFKPLVSDFKTWEAKSSVNKEIIK
jgi:hypothetical protein